MRAIEQAKAAPRANQPGRAIAWAAFCVMALAGTQAAAQSYQGQSNRCQDLEHQLVSEWQRGHSPQEAVARIDQQLEQLSRDRRTMEAEANKRDCYEDLFIFGRSLRRTRACIQLDGDIERVRRDISNLRQQREAMTNSAQRRLRREDLVAELARNGCGENYQREYAARRRSTSFFSLWEDEDSAYDRGYANTPPEQSALPFASYRTMCVRLCDGYYFPVSFSTLGSRFGEDDNKCQEQCAAPAQLFVYKNPGEDVEQMVSLAGEPYANLPNAWRNRKEYIKGCSCKPDEYSAHEIELYQQGRKKQASASPPPSGAGDAGLDPQASQSGSGSDPNAQAGPAPNR